MLYAPCYALYTVVILVASVTGSTTRVCILETIKQRARDASPSACNKIKMNLELCGPKKKEGYWQVGPLFIIIYCKALL
jgi:hypothetical protein